MTEVNQSRRSFLSRLGLVSASEFAAVKAQNAALATKAMRRNTKETASGVAVKFGKFNVEYLTNLAGSKKWDTIDQMVNDPHIKGGLRTKSTHLLTTPWEIEAASDDPKDVEIAEFVGANILRESGDRFGREYWMRTSWMQRLYETLAMLEHGFAMFSKSWRVVNGPGGTRRVIDNLQWLEPSSVDPRGWDLDETDKLVRVLRTYQDATGRYRLREPLDASQIALFPWELRGARYEGKMFIRSAYGSWFRKDFMIRAAAIWAQKVGAPPPVGYYPVNWDADTKDRFVEFIQDMRGTSPAEAYFVGPMAEDGKPAVAEYAGAAVGEVDRMRGLITGENLETAHAMDTKGQMAGETPSGSRSASDTMSTGDKLTVQAIAEWICEMMTHGAGTMPGLIEELVTENYPNVRKYPRLKCGKLDPYEGTQNIAGIVQAKSVGLIPNHPSIRKQVTEMHGLTLPDDEAYEIEEVPAAVNPEWRTKRGDESDRDDLDMAMATKRDEFRARIAPLLVPVEDAPRQGGGFRGVNGVEKRYCALAEIAETQRIGERDIVQALRRTREAMKADLMKRLRAGKITTRTLPSQQASKFRGANKATDVLAGVLDRVGKAGMAHVRDELGRMVNGN